MTDILTNLSTVSIKIDGTVPQDLIPDLDEVIIDSSLHLPDMVTIRIQAPQGRWIDETVFDFGKSLEVEVQAGANIGGGMAVLFSGEITGLEPEFSVDGAHTLTVRGYDKSHRLHLNKIARTFAEQADSDIAKTIATEAGLTADVDATSIKYEYVLQNNQTSMEFLDARARRIGYQVFVLAGKLYFKKGDFSLSGDIPILKLAESLRSFRPRMTVTHQASKVRVSGWDSVGKKAIKSEVGPNANLKLGGTTNTGGAAAKSAFGNKELWAVISDHPVATVDEAKAIAEGMSNDIGSEFIEAEGVCFGDPAVKAGAKIDLQNLGTRFNGKYFVTSAAHVWRRGEYETHFTVSGRRPNTINHLLAGRYGGSDHNGRVDGVVVGLVTNLNDDKNLGRVKVKYPWLLDDKGVEIESAWAKVSAPMAGQDTKGFYFLPEINDEVLVAFEHGDVNRPYVVGALWNNTDKPPEANNVAVKDGKVIHRIIRSRLGHKIVMDDSSDKPSILIVDKTGANSIFIDSAKNDMVIKVQNDLTIEVGRNLKITAKGKIDIDAMQDITTVTKAKYTVDALADTKIATKTNLNLEGTAQANLKALATKVEGTVTVEVKGSAMATVDGGAMSILKGALVKIN